jgi:hypothetical protein
VGQTTIFKIQIGIKEKQTEKDNMLRPDINGCISMSPENEACSASTFF